MLTASNITIVDTEDGTVVYDTSWPVIEVKDCREAFMVGEDQNAYEDGQITEADFIETWGISPLADYTVAYRYAPLA